MIQRFDEGWDEAKHDRDKSGRFAPRGNGGSSSGTEGKQKKESLSNETKHSSRPESATMAAKDSDLSKHMPNISKGAQKAYDKARASEKAITADLYDVNEAMGAKMDGLPFSVKTASSVADKIERKKKDAPWKTDEQIVGEMGDLVRYTSLGEHNKLVDLTRKTIEELEKKGYTINELDNKYLSDGNYKGIHLQCVSKDGQKFEYQIHSKESLDVKNKLHPMYEEARNVATPVARVNELNKKMKELSDALPMPEGIETLKSFVK